MLVQFKTWGNSLAVRIPASAAKEAHISDGASGDLHVENGKLVIAPLETVLAYDLDALLDGITPENLHGEISSGPFAVGNEF